MRYGKSQTPETAPSSKPMDSKCPRKDQGASSSSPRGGNRELAAFQHPLTAKPGHGAFRDSLDSSRYASNAYLRVVTVEDVMPSSRAVKNSESVHIGNRHMAEGRKKDFRTPTYASYV